MNDVLVGGAQGEVGVKQKVMKFNNMIPIFVVNFGHNCKDERLHFIKEELSPWKTAEQSITLMVFKNISIICMIVVSLSV